jgi:DNA-binding NarL/FixJ family response regulator
MVTHTGLCLLHRAEILELEGAWPEALQEARRAGERLGDRTANRRAVGQARYREGEIHRLRGRLAAAEAEYREASRCGWEPQPGLALLRLAQGNDAAAAAAIRRVLGETAEPLRRAPLLAAGVEIMLALGENVEAAEVCRELEAISAERATAALGAMSAGARGAVSLAEGDPAEALRALRRASDAWRELEAPYEDARARTLMGLACRALGDEDAATMELDAARVVFTDLEAAPDLARVEDALARGPAGGAHGLTARELEVLRMVAAGATNRAIAAELVISERTVDRHVSNILTKLRAPSRAAATAYAYEHRLV